LALLGYEAFAELPEMQLLDWTVLWEMSLETGMVR
jgi:hypothetical protein